MMREEHLLTIAAEECVELAQRFTKAQRFGQHQIQPSGGDGLHPEGGNPEQLDNRQRIMFEFSHVIAAMEMLGFDLQLRAGHALEPWAEAKKRKVEAFLKFSKECGTLTEEAPRRA